MYFLNLEAYPPYLEAIFDSLSLILVVFPLLYVFLYKPLKRHILELQQTEKELIEARNLAETASVVKSEFVSNISHEIRTPLTSIIGMVELMKEGTLDKEQRENLALLEKGSENLLDIVNDTLDLSKIEAGLIEIAEAELNLDFEISTLINMFCKEVSKKDVQLTYRLDRNVPLALKGDPLRLRQVLTNVIGNAVKFTPKGKVSLTVLRKEERREDDRVELIFAVKDTGVGIPKEKAEHIFDSFTQVNSTSSRRYGGTGLGLFISKKLVEMMGGRIWVESEEGKGSTFFFTLTLALQEKMTSNAKAADAVTEVESYINSSQPLNILLVEDTEDVRLLIERFLRKTPHTIDVAENGKIAVEKFYSGRYNLILMDMEMPVMDGYTATKKIRAIERKERREPTPVVAVTAHALKELKQKSIDAGCDAHYSKPIKKIELLKLINHYAICNP